MFPLCKYVTSELIQKCLYNACIIANNRYSHYDTLGVSRNATQAEIKGAYYKKSKMYHPDKNEGCEEAATKFRAVTAAYEVLGNSQSRRQYDKEIHGTRYEHFKGNFKPKGPPESAFYRPTQDRPRGKTSVHTVYNFDEWHRAHYGSAFSHRPNRGERETISRSTPTLNLRDSLILFAIFILLIVSLKPTNFDSVKVNSDQSKTDVQTKDV